MSYTKLIYLDELEDLLNIIEESLESDKISEGIKSHLQEILYTLDSSIKEDLITVHALDARALEEDTIIFT